MMNPLPSHAVHNPMLLDLEVFWFMSFASSGHRGSSAYVASGSDLCFFQIFKTWSGRRYTWIWPQPRKHSKKHFWPPHRAYSHVSPAIPHRNKLQGIRGREVGESLNVAATPPSFITICIPSHAGKSELSWSYQHLQNKQHGNFRFSIEKDPLCS